MRLPAQLSALNNLKLGLSIPRRGAAVVGLDIQPGFVAAVQARAGGSVFVEKAAATELAPDTLRDGEVNNDDSLAEALRDLFKESGLGKRVRVGIANQRTVLRTLELPPVTDEKELAAAVGFQAQEQVPMPLNNAVLDFHPLGVIDTPAGPRQRVVLVAAQRDMVERLLGALERAGLTAEGIDLSAFALIRSLYAHDVEPSEHAQRVLYLNVDGLTNLAIAEGPVCRFTRVVGGGIEAMAAELAAKREITVPQARALLLGANLGDGQAPAEAAPADIPGQAPALAEPSEPGEETRPATLEDPAGTGEEESPGPAIAPPDDAQEMIFDDGFGEEHFPPSGEEDVSAVLESGIRDIYGEVRNSLDFHRSQDGGGEVSHVVLSGCAQDIDGFPQALEAALGVEVKSSQVPVVSGALGDFSAHRLAVAAGLALEEIPR